MRKSIYKPYNQAQGMLHFTYDHLITANHIVRTGHELIDGMDTSKFDESYCHLGAHSYDSKMMEKIIVYAYTKKELFITANSESSNREYQFYTAGRRGSGGFSNHKPLSNRKIARTYRESVL